jgi:hypothetical protein
LAGSANSTAVYYRDWSTEFQGKFLPGNFILRKREIPPAITGMQLSPSVLEGNTGSRSSQL